jgi:hypothetical protein
MLGNNTQVGERLLLGLAISKPGGQVQLLAEELVV